MCIDQLGRRSGLTLIIVTLLTLSPALVSAQIKVTLLGTGAPPPVMNRFGPSTLIEAGERKFLFDAGRGAMQRLEQVRVRWQDVDGVFLTHLHSDHVVGFPDLWLTGWLFGARRDRPLRVWGPRGTVRMMDHLEQAFQYDIRIRLYDDQAPPEGAVIIASDIVPGVVFDEVGVRITAFDVDHRPIAPAFGYRVDFAGRSVLLSGDTRVSENLSKHAQGVDLLIHEVVSPQSFEQTRYAAGRARRIIDHHTTPEAAGELFARVKPRLAVYSHIVQPFVGAPELVGPTRKTYSGRLEVGEDLMVIEIADEIVVRRLRDDERSSK